MACEKPDVRAAAQHAAWRPGQSEREQRYLVVEIVHVPVLTSEVGEFLKPQSPHALMVDATLGEGGHAEYFLSRYPDLTYVGVDADSVVLERARRRLSHFGDRIRLVNDWFNIFFSSYPSELARPDLILFDLGISSFHYEESGRGFSFQKDEKLDMRLSEELEISALAIVNEYPEVELANLLFTLGEERYSRQIARAIVRARRTDREMTTRRLADIIRNAVPPAYRFGRIHPATRSFQALRIAVNGELVRLQQALDAASQLLVVGGRIGVISFHSLEDRIVKQFFREKNKSCTCPPEWPMCKCGGKNLLKILTTKPVRPTESEIAENNASRSARLRVATKAHDVE